MQALVFYDFCDARVHLLYGTTNASCGKSSALLAPCLPLAMPADFTCLALPPVLAVQEYPLLEALCSHSLPFIPSKPRVDRFTGTWGPWKQGTRGVNSRSNQQLKVFFCHLPTTIQFRDDHDTYFKFNR